MKTSRLPVRKIIKNNFYMWGIVWHADAGYVCFTLLVRILSGIRTSFLYVYLLGSVLYGVENGIEPKWILLFLLCSVAFFGAVYALEAYYDHVFRPVRRERIAGLLQHKLFARLQRADMENYDSADLHTTITLADGEIAERPLAAADNLFSGLECLVTTCTAAAWTASAALVSGICLISFAVSIFMTNLQAKRAVQYDEDMKRTEKKAALLRRLLYLPEYAKDNRLSCIHDTFLAGYQSAVKEKEEIAAGSGKKIANISFLRKMFCEALCIDFFIPLFLSVGVLLYAKVSISEFVTAINAGAQIQRKLEDLTGVLEEFLKNGRLAQRIRNTEQIPCEIETAEGICPAESMRTLSAHGVSFSYPDGTPGVSGIDLTIQRGSKVAIVGGNGSGKSTLIKILLRLYDAQTGEIRQNGMDIRNFPTALYRSQFAAAFQDFNIYAVSVRENICMGEKGDEERLICALQKAGLAEYIKDLDAPLTREFEEDGILFSGGLLQRLVLARVFYRDSEIVIMDEPTAAMDVFSERRFYDAVFETLKDKTVIFVSHRLSSVTACDKIIYMDHGEILEEGTHESLMRLRGGYYRLFQAQFT